MTSLIIFILLVASCQLVLYLFYRYFIYIRLSAGSMRYTLLGLLFISFVLPLHSVRFELEIPNQDLASETYIPTTSESGIKEAPANSQTPVQTYFESQAKPASNPGVSFSGMLIVFYFLISSLLLIRLLISLLRILIVRFRSERCTRENVVYYLSRNVKNSLSFFGWIFINPEDKSPEEQKNIIEHEKIHVKQLHSLDILIMELVTTFLWFNPGIWMMRKTLQHVHEYLADEGALSTGIDRSRYQVLLLNQVAEERLIALSSGFNPAFRTGRYSFIKKRIIMMTKPKLSQKTNLVLLTFLPLMAILFFGIACVNGQQSTDKKGTVVAVAPTKMNVVYLGVDNPVSIAVSGYKPDELQVEIENGRISGENGEYIIRPTRPGVPLKVFVYADKELVAEKEFRVKTVPNPIAKIGEYYGGTINKEDLLEAGKLSINLENFDFDLKWAVASFVMSATVPNSTVVREEISHEAKFSEMQIDLINSLITNQKLMIEEIRAMGPDGMIRQIPSLVFTIQ